MHVAPTPTFYHQLILKIRAEVYPDDAVVRQVVQAKSFIDRHFFAAIDLNELAGKAFHSRVQFIRLFKACYGCTPHQHLTAVRIAAARKLLRRGVSAKQVCLAVGFASARAVSGLLKKVTRVRLDGRKR
jgi:transcriptional regulator GlxA family with amidase domain